MIGEEKIFKCPICQCDITDELIGAMPFNEHSKIAQKAIDQMIQLTIKMNEEREEAKKMYLAASSRLRTARYLFVATTILAIFYCFLGFQIWIQ